MLGIALYIKHWFTSGLIDSSIKDDGDVTAAEMEINRSFPQNGIYKTYKQVSLLIRANVWATKMLKF
jgi:hypothetical protein